MTRLYLFSLISFGLFSWVHTFVQVGSCRYLQPLTLLQAESIVCSSAVTYPYFLPFGITPAYLNSIAVSKLNNSEYSILPPTCQAALMNMVCSSVYLKCMPGVNLTAPDATWNAQIYSSVSRVFPLPFQRPCISVCNMVTSACLGLTSLFGQLRSCNSRFDYSNGQVVPSLLSSQQPFLYDPLPSSVPQICNPMTPLSSISIASSMETYTGTVSGACAGITTSLYVPPANLVSNGALSPMQSPGVVQTLIESKLQTAFSSLPVWLSQECHFALRKFLCASSFLRPQMQTVGNILSENGISASTLQSMMGGLNGAAVASLLLYSFYMPSYPAREICTEFVSACGTFAVESKQPSLQPNCAATSTSASHVVTNFFPSMNQTVLQVSIAGHPVNIVTSPNNLVAAVDTSGFQTLCPQGFVVPEDPSDPDNDWVPGTGCAVACRAPIFTPSEWKSVQFLTKLFSVIGLCLVILLLALVVASPEWRQQAAVVSFIVSSAVITLWVLIGSGGDPYEHQCRNNANGYNYRDGATLCTVQAGFIVYFTFTCLLSWFFVILQLFLTTGVGWDPALSDSKHLYTASVLGLTYLLPLLVLISWSWFGYSKILPFCTFATTEPMNANLYVYNIPITVITLAGMVLLLEASLRVFALATDGCADDGPRAPTCYALPKDTDEIEITPEGAEPSYDIFSLDEEVGYMGAGTVAGGSAKGTMETNIAFVGEAGTKTNADVANDFVVGDSRKVFVLAQLTVFAILFLVVWLTIIVARLRAYDRSQQIRGALTRWTQCVFLNYDGVSQQSWIDVCGETYAGRLAFSSYVWMVFCTAGQSILVAAIFIPFVIHSLVYPPPPTPFPSALPPPQLSEPATADSTVSSEGVHADDDSTPTVKRRKKKKGKSRTNGEGDTDAIEPQWDAMGAAGILGGYLLDPVQAGIDTAIIMRRSSFTAADGIAVQARRASFSLTTTAENVGSMIAQTIQDRGLDSSSAVDVSTGVQMNDKRVDEGGRGISTSSAADSFTI